MDSVLRVQSRQGSEGYAMTNTQTETKSQAVMARAYLAKHALDTMYTRSQWYRWNGKVWGTIHESLISRELKGYLHTGYTFSVLRQVRSLIEIDAFQPPDTMDSNDEMINLNNGIYHLGKNVLYPHHPDHHITTILPFDYDPKAKCPTWQRYLRSTFVLENGEPDCEMAALVQEAIGYSLTTSTKHQIMFWCYGDGNNGKGTLFYVIKELLGSGRMELNVNSFYHNHYQLALLAGKRVATSAEVNGADKLAEDATIKALVAADPITVRMIMEKPFEMQPTVKLWWSMNKLPPIDETSEGVWRRIRIIPFTKKFTGSEIILDLKDRLKAELPGIFNWAIEGLKRVIANNAICIPTRAAEVKAEYKHESNVVEVFVDEMCTRDPHESTPRPALYAEFRKWSIENGYKLRSSAVMGQELKRLGIHTHKSNGAIVCDGIKLNDALMLL